MNLRLSRFVGTLAMTFAAVAVTSTHAAPPDGKVTINYNRCDNAYDGWGLHAWKNPNIPITNVDWTHPMMPTDKTDFGVGWTIDQSEFGNSGAVNYIVHKGDIKDQNGKDMKFDSKASREVWINSGDSKIYTSLDDAKKGRAEKPCS